MGHNIAVGCLSLTLEQDKRVRVHFQECAWVDTKTAVQIANALKFDPAFAVDDPKRILLYDNLESHIAKRERNEADWRSCIFSSQCH